MGRRKTSGRCELLSNSEKCNTRNINKKWLYPKILKKRNALFLKLVDIFIKQSIVEINNIFLARSQRGGGEKGKRTFEDEGQRA